MNGLLQDLRYALRQVRKNPGFTAVAVITLALGIGANTGIFTLVNAVMLKSLPVPEPGQLYLVRERDRFAEQTRVSYPLYERMLGAMPGSASLAAMTRVGDFYVGSGRPEMTKGQLVSGNYFSTFETYPLLGRLLTPADNRTIDGNPVAVISYGCWKRRFSGDQGVIGRELLINGVRFAIVGVTARDFFGAEPGRTPDFWLPLTMQWSLHYAQHYSKSTSADANKPWVSQDEVTWLNLMLRAKDPSALGRISGELNQLFSQDPWQRGISATAENQPAQLDDHLELVPGRQGIKLLQREFSQPLTVLMGMVVLVLFVACANLAGLLLARAAARTREIAVRLSIGASRSRLKRQLLTECLLLSAMGGLLGIAIAYWCDQMLPKWASAGSLPIPLNLAPDFRVLFFTTAAVLATGALFGIAPAFQAAAVEPLQALKTTTGAGRASHIGAKWSLRQTLIVSQFALALVLLVGAGLFIRTLRNLAGIDPGFDRDHLLNVWINTDVRHYNHDQLLSFYKRVIDRVEALPGVISASLAVCPLASNCRSSSDIYQPGGSRVAATPQVNAVSLGYFENVGIPLVRGRDFALTDDERAPHVAVVNESLARRLFENQDPIGRHFGFEQKSSAEFEIVAVVADARVNSVLESAPPMIYFPLLQFVPDVESLDIRAAADPKSVAEQLRGALSSIDPDLPIGDITTVREQLSSNLAQQRLIARLTSIFGGLALALACLGLYGVMSYTVARRTAELGVRMALGATRVAVLSLILRSMLVVVGAGLLVGLVLSVLSVRAIGSLLFGISPYDATTMLSAAAVLILVSIVAGLKPAWRAALVDPAEALRTE